MGSDGARSRRARKMNGNARALTAPETRYEAAYPDTSATRPSAGCATVPPTEPISESNDSTVARCSDAMMPLRKAWRIGPAIEETSAHSTNSRMAR